MEHSVKVRRQTLITLSHEDVSQSVLRAREERMELCKDIKKET